MEITIGHIHGLLLDLIEVGKSNSSKLDQILKENSTMGASQSQFALDIQSLQAAVDANTAATKQIASLVAADTATIADQSAQIATLKAANPTLDLSGLESNIANLQASNATLTAALTPASTSGTGSSSTGSTAAPAAPASGTSAGS